MSNFVDVTLMTGEIAKINMKLVVALIPATEEDRETRPKVNTYIVLSGGSEKILNIQETPDEILSKADNEG